MIHSQLIKLQKENNSRRRGGGEGGGGLQNRMRHQYSVEDDPIFIEVSTQKLTCEMVRHLSLSQFQ